MPLFNSFLKYEKKIDFHPSMNNINNIGKLNKISDKKQNLLCIREKTKKV